MEALGRLLVFVCRCIGEDDTLLDGVGMESCVDDLPSASLLPESPSLLSPLSLGKGGKATVRNCFVLLPDNLSSPLLRDEFDVPGSDFPSFSGDAPLSTSSSAAALTPCSVGAVSGATGGSMASSCSYVLRSVLRRKPGSPRGCRGIIY